MTSPTSRRERERRMAGRSGSASFPFRPIDPDDPPRFESEASYLARHKLMGEAERAQVALLGLLSLKETVTNDGWTAEPETAA